MALWALSIIPKAWLLLLGPAALILAGYLVEQHYTGRITIFAYAIALITDFGAFQNVPVGIQRYTNIVTILGVIGLLSYAIRFRLFEMYYQVGKIASSVITGVVLLYGASILS